MGWPSSLLEATTGLDDLGDDALEVLGRHPPPRSRAHAGEDPPLADRVDDRVADPPLERSDLQREPGALVEQVHQPRVEIIDAGAQPLERVGSGFGGHTDDPGARVTEWIEGGG